MLCSPYKVIESLLLEQKIISRDKSQLVAKYNLLLNKKTTDLYLI